MRCNISHTFHKYTSNQPFKNDFAQSFSLAFIIRKNALILYSFSEEKEVQNGLFYHYIYKTLVVNWSNMLHREERSGVQGAYAQLDTSPHERVDSLCRNYQEHNIPFISENIRNPSGGCRYRHPYHTKHNGAQKHHHYNALHESRGQQQA